MNTRTIYEAPRVAPEPGEHVVTSTCGHNCGGRCVVNAHVRDGRIVKISTDLYAAGGGVLLAMGSLMVVMRVFATGDHSGEGFGVADLYAIGASLLVVQAITVAELIRRFGGHARWHRVPSHAWCFPPASRARCGSITAIP